MQVAGLIKAAERGLSAGRFADAERLGREAVHANPMSGSAAQVLGLALLRSGRVTESLGWLRRSAALAPDSVEAAASLAEGLRAAGLHAECAASCRRALLKRPTHGEALRHLGWAVMEGGDAAGAVEVLRRAAAASPRSSETQMDLAGALFRAGETDGALAAARVALAISPDEHPTLKAFCDLMCSMSRFEQALDAAKSVPDPAGSNLRGVIRVRQGRFDDAAAEFRRSVEAAPGSAGSWVNLGNALRQLLDFEGARACYARAAEITPDDAALRRTLGEMLLTLGDYPNGFREFEWRWKTGDPLIPDPGFAQPRWRGEDPRGKTIVLHSEQGFGDAVQFARFAPVVAAMGARVVVDCLPPLQKLFESLEGVESIAARGEPLPAFDMHCPLMSLPACLGTTLDTVPASVPYLRARREDVAAWNTRIGISHGMKVGLVWASGTVTPGREYRSIPMAALAELGRVPGVSWFSLQKGESAKDVPAPPAGIKVTDLSDGLSDFAQTAAAIESLDLVITVDTAAAHLAGALGKPVWTMLARVGEWRWALDNETSAWYPTMRLFWQSQAGRWDDVVDRVAAALQDQHQQRLRAL
jgi:Flp pilus assembly protein TadD